MDTDEFIGAGVVGWKVTLNETHALIEQLLLKTKQIHPDAIICISSTGVVLVNRTWLKVTASQPEVTNVHTE